MKERVCALIFAVMVAAVFYIMVATAEKHTAIDNAKLLQWQYEHAVRP